MVMVGSFNKVRKATTALCVLGIAMLGQGCGTSHLATSVGRDTQLQDAMARWDDCANRAASLSVDATARLDPAYCEGYRRDVAVHYPLHLDRRVQNELEETERQRWLNRAQAPTRTTLVLQRSQKVSAVQTHPAPE